MKMKALMIGILLGGCTPTNSLTTDNALSSKSASGISHISEYFDLEIPSDFSGPLIRDDNSMAFWNYNDNTAHREKRDVLIEVYGLESFPQDAACDKKTTGVSSFIEIAGVGDETKWGRTTDYKNIGIGDRGDLNMAPECMPDTAMFDAASSYVFCSEKQGKHVAICLREWDDNPSLARQIFETFKWTN